jgi:hypothetical protein
MNRSELSIIAENLIASSGVVSAIIAKDILTDNDLREVIMAWVQQIQACANYAALLTTEQPTARILEFRR